VTVTRWSLPSEVAAKTCAEKEEAGSGEEREAAAAGPTATAEALSGAPRLTGVAALEALWEVPRELERSNAERRRVQGSWRREGRKEEVRERGEEGEEVSVAAANGFSPSSEGFYFSFPLPLSSPHPPRRESKRLSSYLWLDLPRDATGVVGAEPGPGDHAAAAVIAVAAIAADVNRSRSLSLRARVGQRGHGGDRLYQGRCI